MSISAIGTALSGIQGYQRALDVSAHNVANMLTTDFKARQPDFSEAAPSGTGVNVEPSSNTTEGTDLNTEIVGQLTYKAGVEVSAKVLKTADQMLGALIDTKA
ncbi:hypothetical protein ACUHMQ_19270 [Chitinimonas sp. PSY-7]|uniref:hypothetical protein n=1 Tax=Chitinimonas sp. PSY-7 TaxID=3459088 RepID=UPI00403FEB15